MDQKTTLKGQTIPLDGDGPPKDVNFRCRYCAGEVPAAGFLRPPKKLADYYLPEDSLRPACQHHLDDDGGASRPELRWDQVSLEEGKKTLWELFMDRTVRKVMEE